jgi:hypothetical protein
MNAPFFVEGERGEPLMRELGFMPEPELMNVRAAGGLVLHGYQVPRGQIRRTRMELSHAGLIFHRPKVAGLLGSAVKPWEARWIAHVLGSFLDVAGTATARATFYDSLEDQEAAEYRIHERMFELDRGLYAAFLALPGVSDHTRQVGVLRLLSHPRGGGASRFVDEEEERRLVARVVGSLPTPRMLKLFLMLRQARVNNGRTRRLILRSILGSRQLELWATRYRAKLRAAVVHALGLRDGGIVRAILCRPSSSWSAAERTFLHRRVGRFGPQSGQTFLYECVGFVLGNEAGLTLPLLRSYAEAKKSLESGRDLPYETLEGLRSTYHPQRANAEVLDLTRSQLTPGQRLAMQAKAERDGVSVDLDPDRYDPVRLYLYAFERGIEPGIEKALDRKAAEAATKFPVSFRRLGILVDASASMAGHGTQALRPMATALALRDVLAAGCQEASVRYCGGEKEGRLVRPSGDTSLAEPLVGLLSQSPDAVFILSDGYENAPAGRVAEVVDRIRSFGNETPIYQFSPVFAAESSGVRALSPGDIPAVPINEPSGLTLALLRGMLFFEPVQAIRKLRDLALPGGGR